MYSTTYPYLVAFVSMGLTLMLAGQETHELRYHSSIKTGPIAGTIFSNPAIGDFDGDGIANLIVSTKHHGAGVDFYHGYPRQNDRRLFAAPVRLPIPQSPKILTQLRF